LIAVEEERSGGGDRKESEMRREYLRRVDRTGETDVLYEGKE
jgi:hypothetical protein